MINQVAHRTETPECTLRLQISLALVIAAATLVLTMPLAAHADGTPLPPPPSPMTQQISLTAPSTASAARAGRLVRISAKASDAHGAPLSDAEVSCSAHVGRHVLAGVAASIQSGSVTCVARVPRGTAGKRLVGSLSVSRPDGSASHTFSLLIKP
jgi:hypothetical protein